jgi:Uncharacterized protein conserved in bacteria (DUF2188)
MAANRRTVTPKAAGGWTVDGGPGGQTHRTQAAAAKAARADLMKSGGGELLIKGRDGKVRDQSTIGRKDPPKSKG